MMEAASGVDEALSPALEGQGAVMTHIVIASVNWGHLQGNL